jgi:outer membrane biogenesis lipoprotein LolB
MKALQRVLLPALALLMLAACGSDKTVSYTKTTTTEVERGSGTP